MLRSGFVEFGTEILPQGLKPLLLRQIDGMAEAMPLRSGAPGVFAIAQRLMAWCEFATCYLVGSLGLVCGIWRCC
jgi:hypothetical protein